ncbi:MAG: aminotransferase class III-fold pyridoxal phosphate-dependent enzyme [Blastocatellia bacterium]
MPETQPEMAFPSTRKGQICSTLQAIFAGFFGVNPSEVNINASFIELGADSLFLLQVTQILQTRFGLTIPFRSLIEGLSTIDALAEYIERELPPENVTVSSQDPAPLIDTDLLEAQDEPAEPLYQKSDPTAGSVLEKVVAQQLDVMNRQFDIMARQLSLLNNGNGVAQDKARLETVRKRVVATSESLNLAQANSALPKQQSTNAEPFVADQPIASKETQFNPKTFVAFQPIQIEPARELTPTQQRHLDDLISRLTKRTQESKRLAQAHRQALADSRMTASYRHLWKEMVYQILVDRGAGARVWDIDGNEYVDIAMGFGSLLFGHSPSFVTKALHEEISKGIRIGPKTDHAGRAADLICELTGMERAAFCNSGTEAVMTALRLARASNGRSKIALFTGSYHGTFDGVMVRGQHKPDGRLRATPLAPGVPSTMMDDVLITNYCDPESLLILKEHSNELAAVLVEPQQSRRPDMQPDAFLRELRWFTQEANIPLIFDEVVTGFRMHPGGIQGLLGIKADITTYGKAVGGGLPIGVIAGKSRYLDAIDGGMWSYGDSTYPSEKQTFFAGTFFQHPFVMAVVEAVLNQIKAEGPDLYLQLEERTNHIVDALNDFFQKQYTQIRVGHFKSLFNFLFPPEQKYSDLLFYHLLDKGVFTAETRVCFLSTAHTMQDAEQVIRAVKESVIEMREGGFLPGPDQRSGVDGSRLRSSSAAVINATVSSDEIKQSQTGSFRIMAVTEAQKGLWVLTQMGGDSACAFNESLNLILRGPLNVEAMRRAFEKVIQRHESLRTSFSVDGDYQRIAPTISIDIPLIDISHISKSEREDSLKHLLSTEVSTPFDMLNGPLLRAQIVKLDEEEHALLFTAHHIIIDGLSLAVIQTELGAIYKAEREGESLQLPEPAQFSHYVEWQAGQEQSPERQAAESYWIKQFEGALPILDLPADFARPVVQTYSGARKSTKFDPSLYAELKRLSARQGVTMYMVLLAAFKTLLHHLTEQDDLVVGVHSAGQMNAGANDVVGFCINMLPLRSRMSDDPTFSQFLKIVKRNLLDAYTHQSYPFARLIKRLNIRREPDRPPLISVVFNIDRMESFPEFAGLKVEPIQNPTIFARFDLLWNITHADNSLILNCTYNSDLFDARTIERWQSAYVMLIRIVTERADVKMGELKGMLLESSRQDQLRQEKELEESNLRKLGRIERKAILLTS